MLALWIDECTCAYSGRVSAIYAMSVAMEVRTERTKTPLDLSTPSRLSLQDELMMCLSLDRVTPRSHARYHFEKNSIPRHIESGSENSALSSQRPHGPPMANPTPSIRVAPPDGAGNPIPERFPLGLAPRKPGPLAPARAAGPPKPTRGRADLRVSIAGR